MPHDTLEMRFYRMNEHEENLNAFFQQKERISERRGKFYVNCLNRLLNYYSWSMDEFSEYNLKAFGD